MGGASSQRPPGAKTRTVSQITPPLLNSPAGHSGLFRAASRKAEEVSCAPSQNWAARTSEMRERTLLGGGFVAAGAKRDRPTRSQTTSTATFLSRWSWSSLSRCGDPPHTGQSRRREQGHDAGLGGVRVEDLSQVGEVRGSQDLERSLASWRNRRRITCY